MQPVESSHSRAEQIPLNPEAVSLQRAAELKDGTAEFKDKTSDIDQQIDDEIDEMFDKISGSDYTPVSFVSADNKDIGLVQFAIRTDDTQK